MYIILLTSLILIGPISIFGDTTVTEFESTTEDQSTISSIDSTTTETTSSIASYQSTHYSPFQVSLHYSYNDDFICGGSIIAPKVVLTAAHCMYYRWGGLMPPIIVTVSAGRQKLNETAWRTFEVANITLHPLFNKTTMDNDLALIEIDGKFEADNLIGQIDVEKYISETEYDSCIVTGWNQDTYDFQIMEVILTNCANYPSQICTNKKYIDNSLCINNAGNPLVCDGRLIGVLSVEPLCEDPKQLTIFENIRHSMSWLNDNVNTSRAARAKIEYICTLFLICIVCKSIFCTIKV